MNIGREGATHAPSQLGTRISRMKLSRRDFLCAGMAALLPVPVQAEQPDFGSWGDFLASTVHLDASGASHVDYAGVTPGQKRALADYLRMMQMVAPEILSRPDQAAFWINLYNAQTVQVILDHFPVASIRDINISPGIFSRGPWGKKLLQVGGKPLSLDDIEHGILRPGWKDPRIHYAVNCASKGCPNLQAVPFEAATLESMLDKAARSFVNHPRAARLSGGKLVVSSIYHWFAEDFGGRKGVLPHLRNYARGATADLLAGRTDYDEHDYDWSLNQWVGQ